MPSSVITRTTDTLVIRTRQISTGRIFTLHVEQKPYTVGDVQQIVDTFMDDSDDVLSVWRVETNDNGLPVIVDDISGLFDLRTAQQVSEDSYAAREAAFEGHNAAARLQRHYGTLNHRMQGAGPMNVTITMGHVNDVFRMKQKDKALSEALNFIQHWKRDVEGNVMPTIGSLQHVETTIRAALVAAE